MIGNWEMWERDPSGLFLEYADAYLVASVRTCWELREDKARQSWPYASVVQLLAAHSVELFLKGALASKKMESEANHNLRTLNDLYRDAFPEDEFKFECPFIPNYSLLDEDTKNQALRTEVAPSIEFRYPISKEKKHWRGISGFTPEGYGHVLFGLDADYERLMPLLGHTRIGERLYGEPEDSP